MMFAWKKVTDQILASSILTTNSINDKSTQRLQKHLLSFMTVSFVSMPEVSFFHISSFLQLLILDFCHLL